MSRAVASSFRAAFENTFAQLADFEVAMTRHLEAVADTQSEIAAAQAIRPTRRHRAMPANRQTWPIIWG